MTRSKAYQAAEEKIAEAKRTGAVELNLSKERHASGEQVLTVLPDQLWELRSLKYLDLSGNALSTLPSEIGKLTKLEFLDVSGNAIRTLPRSIAHLNSLESLLLSGNKLTALPEAIGKLSNLRNLSLHRNNLVSIPNSIGELAKLCSIDASYNLIQHLPESIGSLESLAELIFGNNALRTLPESVGQLKSLEVLNIRGNPFESFPESMRNLSQLRILHIAQIELGSLPKWIMFLQQLQELYSFSNGLRELPAWIGDLGALKWLNIQDNQIQSLPEELKHLKHLRGLVLGWNPSSGEGIPIEKLPEWIGDLTSLQELYAAGCMLTDLPSSLARLKKLSKLELGGNPLNPELLAAYEQGVDAVLGYVQTKEEDPIVLHEAKLILVGEGEVGKTSLLSALREEPFVERRQTTHGVEIDVKPVIVRDEAGGYEIFLNCWDFGGQNIYRHTHQLFFTAPAVYLAVWEPRRGPEQCQVAEWIKMIKHRAYDETRPMDRPRILVVATHGGPKERVAHIDQQALIDEFGNLISGFHHVDSKPDEKGECYKLQDLKEAIAREAASIPSVGRAVPLSWKQVLEDIRYWRGQTAYFQYSEFEKLCEARGVNKELASTYASILNELGYLIYYRDDETLRETVILRADYLSKAISFVLEDQATKDAHGLIEHSRLQILWNNPERPASERYPPQLHPVLLRLMAKFDLSYAVVMPQLGAPDTSLLAQLVPAARPHGWEADWVLREGDVERTQVCRVLDAVTGRTVDAEGLIYRLIVRLHRYSMGRRNYHQSRHWKSGMILDDDYNGIAFIEEIGGDVYVTVRAAYPERLLGHLCAEVQWLVRNFWKGLDARLYLPCPGCNCKGLLEMGEIVAFKTAGMPKVRCAVCRQFHEIDALMAATEPRLPLTEALAELRQGQQQILLAQNHGFEQLSTQLRILMSKADERYVNLLAWLADPARDGPRLFSFEPAKRSKFDPRAWTKERFRLVLWCEHSQKPLPFLNGPESSEGVVEVELTRDWFKIAAPVLKALTGTLSLILPVASAGLKLGIDEALYKGIESQLDFGKEIIDASLTGAEKATDWLSTAERSELPAGEALHAHGRVLRELHAMLKAKDPGFGGLERVQNKRREFLWVHRQFKDAYYN